MSRPVCLVVLPLAVALMPRAAAAQEMPRLETHRGVLLKFGGGVGYLHNGPRDGNETTIAGVGAPMNLFVGLEIMDNLFLTFSIDGYLAPNPTASQGSQSETMEETISTASSLGGGIAYYLMPAGIYLQGTVGTGFGRLIVSGSELAATDWGPTLSVCAGKEWFALTPGYPDWYWGIGIGANLLVGFYRDGNDSQTVVGAGLYVSFAAEKPGAFDDFAAEKPGAFDEQ